MNQRDEGARLRLITDNLPGMSVAFDEDQRCVFANRRYAELFGLSIASIIGQHLRDIIGDGVYRQTQHHFDRVLAGHRVTYERTRVLDDGDERHLEIELIPHLAREGQSRGFFAILSDVTQRKRAESMRRASEEKFSKAFHASPNWVALTKLDSGEFMEVNEGFEQISGYSRAESIGHSAFALGVWVKDEQRAALLDKLAAGELVRETEVVFRKKSGAQRLMQVSMETIELGGEQCLITVGRDVTERKRDDELRTLGHFVAELIARADSTTAAVQAVIRTICKAEGWDCGRYFRPTASGSAMRFTDAWGIDDPSIQGVIERSKDLEYGFGKGLVGTVWESARALWIPDRSQEPRALHRVFAAEFGAGGVFLFPVKLQGEVVGVLTFNSREPRPTDQRLLQIIVDIGSQIGQFLQRKTAEEQLRASNQQLEMLVQSSPLAVYTRDMRGLLTSWNPAAEKMYGWTAAEVLGKPLPTVPHESRAQSDEYHKRLLAGEELIRNETRRLRRDGALLDVDVSLGPLRDGSGNINGTISVVADITDRKRLEQALREQTERALLGQRSAGMIIMDWDIVNDELSWSYSPEWLRGPLPQSGKYPFYLEQVHPEDREGFLAARLRGIETLQANAQEYRVVRTDGRVLWVKSEQISLPGDDGKAARMVVVISDVSERKQLERRREMEHKVTRLLAEFASLEDDMPKLLEVLGEALNCVCGTRRVWNEREQTISCAETWNVPSDELDAFMSVSREPQSTAGLNGGLVNPAIVSGEPTWIVDVSRDPGFRRASAAAKAGLRGAFAFPIRYGDEILGVMEFFSRESLQPDEALVRSTRDIGSQIGQFVARKKAEERVLHMAHFDELTGLSNRNMFNERLGHALVRARRVAEPLGILFIDLDRFKNINDTLGHDAGDRALIEIAQRLRACLREADTVSRLGGDEFLVLIEGATRSADFAEVAQKILAAVAQPVFVDSQEFHLSASIGISTFPEAGDDLQGLMKNADIAMYRAKELGKNNYQFYSAEINLHTLEHVALESDLRHALERDEFVLHYQPKIDIGSKRIVGMEALVRWQREDADLMLPARFIPLAEETGLIVAIGEWVLKSACAQNKAWQDRGLAPLRVAVNLSMRQFTHASLLQDVARVLEETGMDPAWLELEITESMVMRDAESSVRLLHELKAMGIHLSIDDFGTGYSSLACLKRFPLDSVKIDSTFIQDLPGDSDDAAITQAIIAMAHSLRLRVIAEGVETEQQLQFLRVRGCDEMQGYHFSKPLTREQFECLLQSDVIAGSEPVLTR